MFPNGIPDDFPEGAPGSSWDRANWLPGWHTMSQGHHGASVHGSSGVNAERFIWVAEDGENNLALSPSSRRKGSATLLRCLLPGHAMVPKVSPACSSTRKANCMGIFGKDARRGLLTGFWHCLELSSVSNWICFPSQPCILQCQFMYEHSVRSKNFLSWLN